MTLIKSISGIRGTIGGHPGEALTPVDIVKFVYAYCSLQRARRPGKERYKVVVGRDARVSGPMVEQLVCGSLVACGVDVVNAGLASTPTTEMAVILSEADGGIIITASHNPRQWNALKLLNEKGEFLSAKEGQAVLELAETGDFDFAGVDHLGSISCHDFTEEHLDKVLQLEAVDAEAVRRAGFKAVVDAVNSVGGVIMPRLLERMGVECVRLNCDPSGNFAHNPEPLPENLRDLSRAVVECGADLGISVDPDVDRLALICENGEPFVEEYTLVSVADYLFSWAEEIAAAKAVPLDQATAPYSPVAVSNLSSSRALRDVAEAHGGQYFASAVGEVNVTTLMHEKKALIGGEGNGGVIYPALHSGRDAMVGVALFLTSLARKGYTVSALKKSLPQYSIAKRRIDLSDKALIDNILEKMKEVYASENVDCTDGVKISFETQREWVHLRRSNTEPIIRVYAEAANGERAAALAESVVDLAASVALKAGADKTNSNITPR